MADGLDFSMVSGDETRNRPVTTIDSHQFGGGAVDAGEIHRYESDVPRDHLYRDDDGSDSADEVDPRLLFRTPTYNEIRWHYRFNSLAKTIVEKPILDAYKNGYEVKNDPTGQVESFLEEYLTYKRDCEIKARRDGPCALFFQLQDDGAVNEPPRNVRGINGFQVLTIDDWASTISHDLVERATGLESGQYVVRESGLIVRDDLSHPNHKELLGYAVKSGSEDGDVRFVHAERCQHFVWNERVDGDIDHYTIGYHEGDSVLVPIFITLKALAKTNWALGETMFRYSAPLYAVETPEGYQQEDLDIVSEQLEGINTASDVALPPGCSLSTEGTTGDLDPQPYVDKLIEQICAGTEFTKSVLMGTQTGTVSGSQSDIKNYFNQIQRYRQGRAQEKIREAIEMLNAWNEQLIPSVALGYELEWQPMFKMDDLERTEAMVRVVTATSNAIKSYELTPEEAREIIQMQWAALDVDIELGDLSEEEYTLLSQINGGAIGDGEDLDERENPEIGQHGGGMEYGQTTEPEQPA